MATPSPTPWATTRYEATGAVDHFHASARVSGTNEFPIDDPTDVDYYVGVISTAFLPLAVVIIIMLPCYWSFLCCRNRCCHSKKCCCKGEDGEGFAGAHPKNHWAGRIFLFGCFALIVGLNLGINNVRLEVAEGSVKVTELLYDVSDMMTDLNNYALDMNTSASMITFYAKNMDCDEEYDSETDGIGDAADVISEAALSISDQISDLPDTIEDLAESIENEGAAYVDQAGLALATLGILYAAFGIVGTLCFEGKSCFFRWSSTLLAFTNAFGVLMLIIIALLLAAELTAGLVLGDFCAADVGPSNAFVAIMQSQQDDDNNEGVELIDFYATCQGTNPMTKYLDAQQAAVTNMTDILDEYKDLFIHENMCCDSSYDTDNIDPDTVAASCTFYSASNPSACTTDSLCDYNGGTNNGGCVAAGGCLNASYTGIVNEINYLALDDDGPLVGFFGEFECAEINPKLAKLINEIMCDSLVESLWWMVAVHISVLILMYIVMCLSSFARQAIYESTLDKDQQAEDVKENYANPAAHNEGAGIEVQQQGLPALPLPK
eukprot:CAMPEP_0119544018 /NCGR_PEP_ID=MMETSP1344-20130328/54479_1 /TAXON_ID=236787 /ORGANISM="Florenciella parvula, Strain CCMP2471" /LENGTH=548 /DNA_ID=CAMNT_0007588457 /DNA_START=113 /DNA_END=1759 /DNA_ORIENTATION=+